ncbi:LysR family transcriptional regulator [Leptotrichia wadei]|uniref:LysR family transcriptional regulator n=1 Tax=Leptotrichia wadei TaxID=157687 RepID=UPI0026EF90A7|nr:LysR family transcriptional regulator [Leptotrichia wadei]
MIELEQLKQLIAFATYGTLSKAAEELYISQPALSRSKKLEKTLEVELFDRKKIFDNFSKNS